MNARSDLARRLVLIGAGAACLALAAQDAEAHDFFQRLLTGNKPMTDFPGTGWDQFAPILSSLALMALGIVALVVGGPIGAALGLGVLGASTYLSYRQGGWQQVLDDHNPFGHDVWDALLNPNLSARERLAKFTLSAFKATSVVPGVRGAVNGLQRFSSVARAVPPRMAGGAARAGARQPAGGPSVGPTGPPLPRRTPPPPPPPPLPKLPRDARAAVAAEKVAYLEAANAEHIVRDLAKRIAARHDPNALVRLRQEGLGRGGRPPVGPFPLQVDPYACVPAVTSKQLERLGIVQSPLDVELRARRLGVLTETGITPDGQVQLLRSYGLTASAPPYSLKQTVQDLLRGKQVSVGITTSSNPSLPNLHCVDVRLAPPHKGVGPMLIVGDPHSGWSWPVTLAEFRKMQPCDPVVAHR